MGTHPIFESDFDCLTDFAQKTVMPPKFDPSAIVEVYLRVVGGEVWCHLLIGSQNWTAGSLPQKGGRRHLQGDRRLEGTQNHSQTDHPKQTSTGLCCAVGVFFDH